MQYSNKADDEVTQKMNENIFESKVNGFETFFRRHNATISFISMLIGIISLLIGVVALSMVIVVNQNVNNTNINTNQISINYPNTDYIGNSQSSMSATSLENASTSAVSSNNESQMQSSSQDVVPRETIVVPDVIGMEQEAATRFLLECGFSDVTVWGKDIEAGTYYIIDQSIVANTTIEKGLTIELTRIAVPPGTNVTVPNVTGMEQTAATDLLTMCGLQYQVWWTEENNTGAERYYIIGQSIPEGSTVPSGTLVQLELSPMQP